jgi:hypothetical protein
MEQQWRRRNSATLAALVVLASAYVGWFAIEPTLTGSRRADAILSVLLGLYICSHPAANAVDLLFFRRDLLREIAEEWWGVAFLALNLLVLFLGWLVITLGATRLVG